MITLENYEEYLILFVDDELSEVEQKELAAFLKQYPHLQKELEDFQKTKLPAATDLHFADKERLLKKEPTKTILLTGWRSLAAAVVLLLIAFAAFKWMKKPSVNLTPPSVEIAKTTAPQQPIITQEKPSVPAETLVKTTRKITPKKPIAPASAYVKHDNKTRQPTTETQHKETTPTPPKTAPVNPINTETVSQGMPLVQTTSEPMQNTTAPMPETEVAKEKRATKKQRSRFLANLFISAEKRQGLAHLRNQVEERVATVKSINENIKNTSVEIKLGSKELFVLNF